MARTISRTKTKCSGISEERGNVISGILHGKPMKIYRKKAARTGVCFPAMLMRPCPSVHRKTQKYRRFPENPFVCGVFLRLSGLHRLRVQRMLRHEKPFRMGRSVMAEGENVVVPCGCPDFGEIPLDPVVVVAACKQTVFLCIDRRHVILVFCPVHVPDLDAVRGVQCTSYRCCLSSMRVSFFIFPLYRAFRPSHSRTAHAHTMLRSRRSVP